MSNVPQNELSIGEKIETIIFARRSGRFGEYLGSTAKTFGAVRVDGVIYKIKRNIEANDCPAWTIKNVSTGEISTIDDIDFLGLFEG